MNADIQRLSDRFIGRRVFITGRHPHKGKIGTVDRLEFAAMLRKWGFVVNLDDGQSAFVFSPDEWKIIGGDLLPS